MAGWLVGYSVSQSVSKSVSQSVSQCFVGNGLIKVVLCNEIEALRYKPEGRGFDF
jgi:hypothetical protein